MRRVVSVWLPMWPKERLRRTAVNTAPSDEVPLVVAGRVGNCWMVTAVDTMVRGLGLSAGMPVSTAQALVPAIVPAHPAVDAEGIERRAS